MSIALGLAKPTPHATYIFLHYFTLYYQKMLIALSLAKPTPSATYIFWMSVILYLLMTVLISR